MAWFRPLGAVSVTLGVALAAGCGGSEDNSLFNGAGASAGAGGSAGSSSGASGGSSNGGTASGGTASGGTASGGTGNGGGAAGSGGGTSGGSAGNAGSSTGGSAGSQAGGTSGNGAGGSATGGSAGSTGGSGGASGCKINADCKDAALYCKKDQCGDATGSCEKRSEGCTQQRDTVCGCDGVTYWNSCLAGRRGMNVAAKGECSGSE
ncbi:MAG: hypothetical protein KC766_41955, partial [Myxococcales bacterium]|nr:hypothetical protein [Myxococcales bacterium]